MMNTKKILILLIALVVLINYINYGMSDSKTLVDKIALLENKIDREKRLNQMELKDKNLTVPEKKLFFDGAQYTYSKAMGELQQNITESANKICKIKNIKWAQVPAGTEIYDRLSLDVILECKPKNFFYFVNNLREKEKLTTFDNLLIGPVPKKNVLIISFQIHGFRIKDDV